MSFISIAKYRKQQKRLDRESAAGRSSVDPNPPAHGCTPRAGRPLGPPHARQPPVRNPRPAPATPTQKTKILPLKIKILPCTRAPRRMRNGDSVIIVQHKTKMQFQTERATWEGKRESALRGEAVATCASTNPPPPPPPPTNIIHPPPHHH
jgi:hypothetical protein